MESIRKKRLLFEGIINGNTPSLQNITQIYNFSATNYFGGAPCPQANTTAFTNWVAVLPTQDAVNQIICRRANTFPNTNGWALNAIVGGFRLSVGNGGTVNGPNIGNSLLEIGKVQVLHSVIDAGFIYLFKNGVQIGSGVALPSYTNTSSNMNIGGNSGAEYFRGGIIAVGICENTALSPAQVLAHYNNMRNDVYSIPPGATNLFRSIDLGATTWPDSIGGVILNKNGAPLVETSPREFYNQYNPNDYVSDSIPILPAIPNIAASMKILPLGDSRTLGTGGTNTNSYRNGVSLLYLADPLIDQMVFVGPTGSTAIQPQHDGQAGWTAGNHLTGGGAIPPFVTILTTYNAKFYVIWIGTNSFGSDAAYSAGIAAYITLIQDIINFDPDARIVVVDCTPNTSSPYTRQRVYDYNYWLWNIAWPQLEAAGGKLIKTKIFPLVTSADYADAVHLNDAGYAKLVTPIFNSLKLAAGY